MIPGAAFLAFKFSPVLAFWISHVISRPFGASFADWLGADKIKGGEGFGFGSTALVLTVAILALVLSLGKETPLVGN